MSVTILIILRHPVSKRLFSSELRSQCQFGKDKGQLCTVPGLRMDTWRRQHGSWCESGSLGVWWGNLEKSQEMTWKIRACHEFDQLEASKLQRLWDWLDSFDSLDSLLPVAHRLPHLYDD